MAKIEDFHNPKESEKRIEEAFEKGFHLHWITLLSSLIEQFLVIFYFMRCQEQERLDKEHIEFVKRLNYYALLSLL